jgi:hypothetical protein
MLDYTSSSSQRKLGSMVASGCQVRDFAPIRINRFDKLNFPRALPSFHRFFAGNGVADIEEMFDIDEARDIVAVGEPGNDFAFVLKDTARQITGDADVKRAMFFDGKNVNDTAHAGRTANFVRPVDPSFRWDDEKGGNPCPN